jgi:dipeptidyl aminopeptidase/acylaminoacyl peptidase
MIAVGLLVAVLAQAPAPPAPQDFAQFERLTTGADHGGLSPDGRWLVYTITRSDRSSELRVVRVADGATKAIAYGTLPSFSADSRFLAASVGVSEGDELKLRKEKKPVHRKLAIVDLSTLTISAIDEVESFAFDAGGGHLLIRHYAPDRKDVERKDTDRQPLDPEETVGATAVVRDLAAAKDTTFGNVADAAWQTKGPLLAIAVGGQGLTGNGVQLFDPAAGTLRVLDSGAARYLDLTWRKDAGDLAYLKSRADASRDGLAYDVHAWTAINTPSEREAHLSWRDGSTGDQRISAFRRPSWSDQGGWLFVGVAPWPRKSDRSAPDLGNGDGPPAAATDKDERASVDVWHAKDVDVMPKQKVNARRDSERTFLAAWKIGAPSLTVLAHDYTEQVSPLAQDGAAYAVSWTSSALERSWGRFGSATLFVVDGATGARTQVAEHVDDRFVRPSPGGRYILYYVDGQFSIVDVAQKTARTLTRSIPTSFADVDSDETDVTRPWFGIAGWTKDDRDVLLYDKHDIWQVPTDGGRPVRLTDGAADEIRYRYVDVDPDTRAIDRARPIYLSMFGLLTRKSGFGRLAPNATSPERLLWMDKDVARLGKAKDAPVFDYVVQSFDDSPDAFVGGADLKDARQVTTTNAFQSRYAWGRSELVAYKSERGARLQGVLRYPAGYERGRAYPMIVYVYEKLSDTLHQYSPPSERDYYNVTAFQSAGYFVLEPDIVFRAREPGLSVVECVRPAVAAVAAMGVIDPKRVGIVGHSWGGFDTAYLATHTTVFAAAVAGAPITDLVSNYGNHHWGPGIAETDHIETGQQRMQVPLYEDPEAYVRNSAVFGVATMTTPLLIEVGDADGTVFWHQGVELYNVARRARKNVVLLVYANEDHGLRQKPDQIDYHRRIMEWFGHYLKGDAAAPWITNGVAYLDEKR